MKCLHKVLLINAKYGALEFKMFKVFLFNFVCLPLYLVLSNVM